MMNVSIVEIFIPKGIVRHIALHDGMEVADFRALLSSCFMGCEIIGLQNSQGVIFPISMIIKKPKDFGNKKFAAVVKQQISGLIVDIKLPHNESQTNGLDFENELENKSSISMVEFSRKSRDHHDFIPENTFSEFRNMAVSIAEAKALLGLGKYSSEFIIDFLIGKIGNDYEASGDESSWLITEQQFDSAMLQLLNRQYVDLTIEQRSLSDYLVHSIFTAFDEERSGYCDLTELGCGLMLFSGGEIVDRAQMAYKLVAEWHGTDDEDGERCNQGVKTEMMTTAIASVLKVVAILNSSYLNSCDPLNTADEITKRAFIRAKLRMSADSVIGQDDFEYWFSVVLTIYDEVEEEEQVVVKDVTPKYNGGRIKQNNGLAKTAKLSIDTESAKYNADTDLENGDVRVTMAPNAVVLELQRAKSLLGLAGVAAEDLMELLGEVSSEGLLSEETWREYLSEFVVGSRSEKKIGVELGMLLFRAFDFHRNNEVNYIDFCAGLTLLSDSPVEDKIMVAFVLNDTESIGMISVPELQSLILGSLRVVAACSTTAAQRIEKGGIKIEELARLTVLEGLAVMELSTEDSLTLETVSEIALKCIALSAK